MTMRTGLIALSSAVLLSTTPAHSQEVNNGLAQCGIGAAFFPNSSTAAVFSNVIWDLGTTAVSSQTSSPSTCAGAQNTATAFIHETYPVLEEQFVKGGGQHVAALLNILSCETSLHSDVISSVQSDLSVSLQTTDFASASRVEKSQKLAVSLDKAISACSV